MVQIYRYRDRHQSSKFYLDSNIFHHLNWKSFKNSESKINIVSRSANLRPIGKGFDRWLMSILYWRFWNFIWVFTCDRNKINNVSLARFNINKLRFQKPHLVRFVLRCAKPSIHHHSDLDSILSLLVDSMVLPARPKYKSSIRFLIEPTYIVICHFDQEKINNFNVGIWNIIDLEWIKLHIVKF